MPKMTGNQYFAEMVKAYGISHVFFVPTIMIPAMAALEGSGVKRVVAHGEKAAAYMADGYARAGRRPGVALAQTIGSANLAAGMRDAYMACSPVVALTGGVDPATHYRHAYQEIEDFSMWDPVTKANFLCQDPSRFPDLLRQAFRTATTGAPGPTHIELVATHGTNLEREVDLDPLWEPRFNQTPPFRPEPEIEDVRAAARALAEAERPIIIAGGGVMWSGAEAELRKLAEMLNIPVATSLNAKAALPDDHPLNVGVPGTYSRWSANRAIAEADLVFFVGSHAGGQVTHFQNVPKIGVPTIQLDIDPQELGRIYPNKVSINADAKAGLQKLIDSVEPIQRKEWTDRVQSLVREYWAETEPMLNSDQVPLRPERILKELSEWLPNDGVVVSDTGHSGMWTAQALRLKQGQRFLRCAGSLGWGFPATLGAKAALPNQPVVCFTGDGGFYYHLSELETAVRYGINAVILVNNNFALNQEESIFNSAYGGDAKGQGDEMWHFEKGANLAEVAKNMGAFGVRVEKAGDIKGALDQAVKANRPAVVEVISDVKAMSKRAWLPTPAAGH